MAQKIHVNVLREMLKNGDPVDLDVWAKDGRIIHYENVIPLRYDFYKGTRNIKVLKSREIRSIRDILVFRVNGLEVFL